MKNHGQRSQALELAQTKKTAEYKPLIEQINDLMKTTPPHLLNRPWSMAEIVARLAGKYRERPHPQHVGQVKGHWVAIQTILGQRLEWGEGLDTPNSKFSEIKLQYVINNKFKIGNHMLKINLAISLLLFYAEPAWAYLDPGSVSLWLQGILASIAAIASTSRFWWFKLKEFVKKLFKS